MPKENARNQYGKDVNLSKENSLENKSDLKSGNRYIQNSRGRELN
jgi:hypothetical protein